MPQIVSRWVLLAPGGWAARWVVRWQRLQHDACPASLYRLQRHHECPAATRGGQDAHADKHFTCVSGLAAAHVRGAPMRTGHVQSRSWLWPTCMVARATPAVGRSLPWPCPALAPPFGTHPAFFLQTKWTPTRRRRWCALSTPTTPARTSSSRCGTGESSAAPPTPPHTHCTVGWCMPSGCQAGRLGRLDPVIPRGPALRAPSW